MDGFEPGQELEEIRFRRSRQPNYKQREDYLELLAQGVPQVAAARKVGSTASAFNGLKHRDGHFAALCAAADRAGGKEEQADFIRGVLWHIVLDDKHPKHVETAWKFAEALLGEFDYKRVKAIRHGQDGPFQIQALLPDIDLSTLSSWPQEKLDALIALIEELQPEDKKRPLRAIEGGRAVD